MLLATLLSFAVARTITRPLAAITDVMREVAATGDLTRKIAVLHASRWDDEDARLLATTFNTLTDSIARFQRDMSQKERLTSLGRLSTVIAHEVRNPLMIIKASLHTLRQADAGGAAVHEAAADIDGEVARLNRIVNEVLDFARPIRFELSPVSVTALCRESAAAALASGPGAAIACDLDPALGTLTTDPERLRIALVNLLINARHAVNGGADDHACGGPGAQRTGGARVRDRAATRMCRWSSRRPLPTPTGSASPSPTAAPASAAPTSRRSSTRTSRPSAAAPGWDCRFRRTSSRDSAARSPSRARPGAGTEIGIEFFLPTPDAHGAGPVS